MLKETCNRQGKSTNHLWINALSIPNVIPLAPNNLFPFFLLARKTRKRKRLLEARGDSGKGWAVLFSRAGYVSSKRDRIGALFFSFLFRTYPFPLGLVTALFIIPRSLSFAFFLPCRTLAGSFYFSFFRQQSARQEGSKKA